MILAGIDIGTNTLRLLIAETGPDSLREIHSLRTITRLGEGLDRSGKLLPEAMERSLAALELFQEAINAYGAAEVSAVGTSALRKAHNSEEFLAAVLGRTSIPIRIIPGDEEARLTVLGVLRGLKPFLHGSSRENMLLVDIGGGSTELIAVDLAGSSREVSLPLGAVYLTERFIRHDPPEPGDVAELRREIRTELLKVPFLADPAKRPFLVGTAGTITTLAAMDQRLDQYDPERINGTRLTGLTIDSIARLLAASTLQERRSLAGLEQGREDIILAGAVITQEIMAWTGLQSLIVSEWGLREGIIADLYDNIVSRRGGNRTAG